MTTSFTKESALYLLLLLPFALVGQDAIEWQPELSLTWQPDKRWQINLKTVSYHRRAEAGAQGSPLATDHLEWALMGTYRLLGGSALSLGYAFRLREPFDAASNIEDRITSQFVAIQRKGKFRIGHRWRAEQRFRSSGLIHRWRYRLSLDFPLNGEQIDTGELYFKGSEELLWSMRKAQRPAGENRIGGGIGWQLSPGTKLEVLAEYRLSGFQSPAPAHRLVCFSALYVNL